MAALFTSFYSWRLMFMTFYGKARGDKHTHDHAHESPRVMTIPLGVLAVGAIFSGMVFYSSFFGNHDKVLSFFGMPAHHAEASEHGEEAAHGEQTAMAETATEEGADEAAPAEASSEAAAEETAAADTATEEGAEGTATAGTPAEEGAEAIAMADEANGEDGDHAVLATGLEYGAIYMAPDNTVMDDAHHAPIWVKLTPFVAMLIGFGVAYWFYIVNPTLPRKLAEQQRPLYLFLLNKWYFDEVYDFLFVRSAKGLGRFFWKRGDGGVIDGDINGLAMGIIPFFTKLAGRAQSGFIFTYAFAMVIGIVLLVTWMSISGGAH